jgi:hypothetical protein
VAPYGTLTGALRGAADLAGPDALALDPRFAGVAAAVLAGAAPGSVPALLLLHEAHALRGRLAADAGERATADAAAAECRLRLAVADPGRRGLWRALGGEE